MLCALRETYCFNLTNQSHPSLYFVQAAQALKERIISAMVIWAWDKAVSGSSARAAQNAASLAAPDMIWARASTGNGFDGIPMNENLPQMIKALPKVNIPTDISQQNTAVLVM